MQQVAVTGLSGVIGSLLLPELLKLPNVHVIDWYHRTPIKKTHRTTSHHIDLTSPQLLTQLKKSPVDAIIHLAAVTHIDRCEDDKVNGKDGIVWKSNVTGTQTLAQYAQEIGAQLTFLSTECVFNGETGMYAETATPSPKNWYGTTKAAAESYVTKLGNKGAVIRAAIAYNPVDTNLTMFGKIARAFEQKKPFSVVKDQVMTPTHTDDIITAIIKTLTDQVGGIFHVSSNQEITPYEFSQVVAQYTNADANLAKPVSMRTYLGAKRANLRLKRATLDGTHSQKILGFSPRTPQSLL